MLWEKDKEDYHYSYDLMLAISQIGGEYMGRKKKKRTPFETTLLILEFLSKLALIGAFLLDLFLELL